MHRREHKTPELRERTNASERHANFDSSLHFHVSDFLFFLCFWTTIFLPLTVTRTPVSPVSKVSRNHAGESISPRGYRERASRGR